MNLASVGVYLPTMDAPERLSAAAAVRVATLAERLGYASVWVGDHVQWRTAVLDPLSVLGAVAASTSRLRLGTAVLLLPVRHPVLVAKSLVTLDHLSAGRLVAGFGTGTTSGNDYGAIGSDPHRRGATVDSAVPVLRALLRGDRVNAAVGGWRLRDAQLSPRTMQERVPFYFGGRAAATLRRVARWGDGWIASFMTTERLAETVRRLGEHLAAEGRNPVAVDVLVLLYVEVAASVASAVRRADAYLVRQYGLSARDAARMSAFGPPGAVIERLAAYREAGATGFIVACASEAYEEWLNGIAGASITSDRD